MSGITPSTEWEFELRRENFINLRINWEKLLKDIRRKKHRSLGTALLPRKQLQSLSNKNAFVFNPFSDFCHQNKVIFLISIALFTLKSENKSRITSASPNPAAILRFWFSARLTWQSRDSRDGRHMIVMPVTCLWQTEIIRLSLDQSF